MALQPDGNAGGGFGYVIVGSFALAPVDGIAA